MFETSKRQVTLLSLIFLVKCCKKATDYWISHCLLLWFTYNTVLVLPLMAVQVKAPAHTLSMVNEEFWRMRTIHRMVALTLTKTKSLLTTPH